LIVFGFAFEIECRLVQSNQMTITESSEDENHWTSRHSPLKSCNQDLDKNCSFESSGITTCEPNVTSIVWKESKFLGLAQFCLANRGALKALF
jgi:hypothetical protein